MMMSDLKIGTVMPMMASAAPWPRTANEAKKWCRARNEESRARREHKDTEHRRWLAEHAQLSRELQDELTRRQGARTPAPAPKRPVSAAPSAQRPATLSAVAIYQRWNARVTAELPPERAPGCSETCAAETPCEGACAALVAAEEALLPLAARVYARMNRKVDR